MNENKSEKEKEQELFEHGLFYLLNEKYDQAIDEFQRVLRVDPENVEAYYSLGLAYESKNISDKAKEMYKKVLERNPKHKLAREHFEKLVGI